MNSLIKNEFPLHETQSVRYDLMKTLTDSDLAYKLPGDNPTLGELCRKTSVYLKALQKSVNDQWRAGIG
jgi:hypothetical protein